jgi:hypothetical protein
MNILEKLGINSSLKDEEKIRTQEESFSLIEEYVKEYEDIIDLKNHKKYKLSNRKNVYRFTVKAISLDFLQKMAIDKRVKDLFFSPSTPPPGGGFDSISMRYKVYIQYY